MLGDTAGWRALAYLAAAFPLALISAAASVGFLASGLGGLTHWVWSRWLPLQAAGDGSLHRGLSLGGLFFDTVAGQLSLAAVGVVLLFVWPWVNHGFADVFRLLVGELLGLTPGARRLRDLEVSRGRSVEDADARLRRIERDLHDGTQARLVAVAMQLGEARELLGSGVAANGRGDSSGPSGPDGSGGPAGLTGESVAGGEAPRPTAVANARALVELAHAAVKGTAVELREIVRNIHPPVLDDGLEVALESLASRVPLPVRVHVELRVRPSPAIETMLYFCAAELLTNVVKHGGATHATVTLEPHGRGLRLRVQDDGTGGAQVWSPDETGRRSGLVGLAERVRPVDGRLELHSPAGGPTVATVTLPGPVA
ncbi:hypothetical protein GCM10025865_21920 [Paraoerskovia sediminicola]|uniref:histidine kinase n=2 Tax=Paraoerskovia sediminicola TaxID=1138587 RepID=A0ABN6XI22_9CELL|nr:hypothetical protein GCM10025865_21920 [Paraoerskovia sediminicola]